MREQRRFALAVVVAGLIMGLSACGGDSNDTTSGSASGNADTSSSAPGGGSAAFIGVAPVTSGNWDPPGYQAFVDAAKQYGFKYSNQESVGYDQAAPVLKRLARSNDVVIAHSSGYEAAVMEVAPDFPKTWFLLFSDLSTDTPPKNVAGWAINWNEYGYLAGASACIAAKEKGGDTIGHVNSSPIPAFTRYAAGVKAGATAEGCNFLIRWTNSFTDVAKAKQAALAMIADGADVITSSADTADEGSRDGAVEKDKLFIANYVDGIQGAPENTMVSILLGFKPAYDQMLQLASEGKLEAKKYPLDATNGGITFGEFANVSDEVKTQAEEVFQQVKSGDITVDAKAELKP